MTIVFCFSLLTLIAVELHARWVMPKTIYIIDNAISGLLGNYSAVFWIKLAVWILLLLVLILFSSIKNTRWIQLDARGRIAACILLTALLCIIPTELFDDKFNQNVQFEKSTTMQVPNEPNEHVEPIAPPERVF